MKIVVTGCAGFIGSNFANYWLNSHTGDTVIGIDCLTYAANITALSELKARDKFKFYKANICNKKKIQEIFVEECPDAVINFAAESHVDRSIADSGVFVKTNVLGTQTLLDACLKCGISRFHQISTDEVYGDMPLDLDVAFTEKSPLNPSSPYSASKAAADLLALSYCKTHGLFVTVSRCANNYGKYQHTEKLIPKIIEHAINNKAIPIYGNGLNVRDWIHVLDHCRAVDTIIQKAAPASVYNIGSNTLLSNLELTKQILFILGKREDLITFVADRPGHDRKYALDCTKLTSELGWCAQDPFSRGLEETISHYVSKFNH